MSKQEKRKRKKNSFTLKILSHKQELSSFEFIFMITIAFLLDTLKMLVKMICWILISCIIVGSVGGVIAYSKIKPYYKDYYTFAKNVVSQSTEDSFRNAENSYIYDSNGKLLVKLKSDKDTDWIDYDNIPEDVINAFISVEDRTFWENPGYDIKGIIRVGLQAVKTKGNELHGASTITQQLARNIFLTHEVSIERKAKEILIAKELTEKYSKKQIMEFYVNDICYANAYYGIGAAAKGYFNTTVDKLSLSQIAYLCAIPNSPTYYDPYKYSYRALERRDKILDNMQELGYISSYECKKAKDEEIIIEKPETEFNNYETTYAIDCAIKYFMKLNNFNFKYEFESNEEYRNYQKDYDEAYAEAKNQLYTGGYKIYTTLDSAVQARVQEIINEQMMFDTEIDSETGMYTLQSASTVINNNTRKVIAIVGGRTNSQEAGEQNSKVYSLNRAYQSYRQPGSTIKPLIVYTPALERGYTPNSLVKNINIDTAKKTKGSLDNIGGEQMTMRSALEQSKNGAAWWLMSKVEPRNGLKYLTNMKFESIVPDDYFMASSLGGLTYGVTTVEMAGAYSALENHGYWIEPTCIEKIIDSSGVDIYRESEGQQIYKEQAADNMMDMMKGVLIRGTAKKLDWYKSTEVEAACKTGTTNNCKDGWLCGFTPYYTVTVWVGYDQPKTLNNLYGATYPGQIWKAIMLDLVSEMDIGELKALEDYDKEETESIYGEGYYSYLEGRDDNEVLSDGYTVADYRTDRVKGETTNSLMLEMYYIDVRDSNYLIELQEQYNSALASINDIYSTKYKNELTAQALAVYNECLKKYNQYNGNTETNNTETNNTETIIEGTIVNN